MKVLFLTQGHHEHDRRFGDAIAALGFTPSLVVVSPGRLSEVRRAIQEVRPDVIHAGPIPTVARDAALCGARPLVTMSWGFDLAFEEDESARKLVEWTLARSDVLLADCEVLAARARLCGIPADRTFVLPWGVDLQRFTAQPDRGLAIRKRLGWSDQTIVLSARSHEPIYGVDTVVDGFATASASHPELRLLIIGDGSLTNALRARIASADLTERIAFVGRVPNEAMTPYFSAADIYVSAARMDGSSVTMLEAMACERPVIVSDLPSNREWVEEASGRLFPVGDAAALGSALSELAQMSVARRATLGRRGRAIATQRADWTRNVNVLRQAYQLARDRVADEKGRLHR